jgi:5-methyltetrahydropteroyltriglutamate--homocysteine methyltransferase
LLRREVESTLEYNVYVQVDEPILSDRKTSLDDVLLSVELVNRIIRGVEERSILSVYFDFPSRKTLEALLDCKARYLMVDIADSPKRALEESVPLENHIPVVGVVDGRRIHTDRISEIELETIKKLDPGAPELVITTSTWLDLIPYRYALKKVWLLGSITQTIADKLGGEHVTLWR